MITVQSLYAGYGKLEILHGINLTFAEGRFTAVLGPNGSGKSTLMKSILGLATVISGSIKFDGQELVGIPTQHISKLGIAYVPQRENVFTELSVHDNLLLGLRAVSKDQHKFALDELYDLFPILGKRARQKAGQLSGGERQMVAIAIARLTRPTMMLLDEPSAGLAPAVAGDVLDVLTSLSQQGITLVVIEQNARRILQYCDDTVVLREGQVVFQGSAADCLNDEETVKGYLGAW